MDRAVDLFRKCGAYNAWMNDQILGACDGIPDARRKEDRGAFFGSIHDTLVHILVSDKHRMHQFDPGNSFWPGTHLKETFANWKVLRQERRACDREMLRWLESLSGPDLDREVETDCWVDERRHRYPLRVLLMHTLNHQVHHRGQVTTLMWQLGVDFGVTGFAWQPALLETSTIPEV